MIKSQSIYTTEDLPLSYLGALCDKVLLEGE
jgi:hypothetical protein